MEHDDAFTSTPIVSNWWCDATALCKIIEPDREPPEWCPLPPNTGGKP